jgi:ribosomal protein L37AE/L43A
MSHRVSSSSHFLINSGHFGVMSGHFSSTSNVKQPTTPDKKKYKCDKCGKRYTDKSNMYRHQRSEICKNFVENNSENSENSENSNNSQNFEMIQQLKKENEYLKTALKESGGVIKKTVGALAYVVKNYPNAPALELLEQPDYSVIKDNGFDMPTTLVHYYREKSLDKYLGDYVIEFYLSSDPENQPMWNTDVVRKTFVVRQVINNKTDWVVDKVAIKIGKTIIDPMLDYIKIGMKIYCDEENKQTRNMKQSVGEMGKHVLANADGMDIVRMIESGDLKNDIIRYIAPHFFLSRTKQLE